LGARQETRSLADRQETDIELERACGAENEPPRLDPGNLRRVVAERIDKRRGDRPQELRLIEPAPDVGVAADPGEAREQCVDHASRSVRCARHSRSRMA
jgi:hypothetical protein